MIYHSGRGGGTADTGGAGVEGMQVSYTLISAVLIAAVLYNLVLVVVFLRNTRPQQAGRWFVWYILSVTAWIGCEALIDYPQTSQLVALWASRAMFFFGTTIGISILWFCATFPRPDRRFYPAATILSVLGLPWLALFWTDIFIIAAPQQPWSEYLEINNTFTLIYSLWVFACLVASIIHLTKKARRVTGIERQQVQYLLLGICILLGGGLLFNLLLPGLTGKTTYSAIGPLFGLGVTTTATYALVRFRMMDISLVLNKGLTYSVTLVAISALFAVIILLFNVWLAGRFVLEYSAGGYFAAVIIAIAFQPIQRRVQRWVDRAFFKSVYDYRRTIIDAGNAFASARSSAMLVELFISTLDQTMRPQGAVVFLPNDEGVLVQVSGTAQCRHLPTALPMNAPVVEYLVEQDHVVVAEELVRRGEPHQTIGRRIADCNLQVLIPFTVAGRINGLAALTDKQSGDPYTVEDLDLLHTLGRQAAVALDNYCHYDELLRLNAELEERVADRMRDLNAANMRLREADKAKDEFLAILPHELLTPLTSILGWAQMARETGDAATTLKALEVIERNAQRQRHILDDLLDMSRIIHQKFSLVPERTDMWDVTQQCADTVQLTAAHRNVTLVLEPPETPLPIFADANRLTQAICNLLNNALKFTEPGGVVTLVARRTGDMAVLEVRDTGRGIPPEMLGRIFSPFQQVDRHETKGGLGLGLALVKGIIELHGGEVYADSPGEDKGSIFTIALPMASSDAPMRKLMTP